MFNNLHIYYTYSIVSYNGYANKQIFNKQIRKKL